MQGPGVVCLFVFKSQDLLSRNVLLIRAATATKASKARALPKFWVTVNPISTSGADYAHHSTMGLVWLKFAVAALAL